MVVIKILLATATFPFLNAIIVDSYYTPSQNKEQLQAFQPIRPPPSNRQLENPNKESYHSKENSESYTKPLYKYGYSVLDPYTLDVKSHWEHRDGDFVKGAYNMLEADGSMRIVEYVSDKDTGFRAVVKKIPHYLKNERPGEIFPLKSNNFPEQFFSPPKPAPLMPAPFQHVRDKGHVQNYHENAIIPRDKGHSVQNYHHENIIPRDKGQVPVQNYHENLVIPRDEGHLQNYHENLNIIPRDKGHLQNYHENINIIPRDKGHLQNYHENLNVMPRDKGHLQNYQENLNVMPRDKGHLHNYHENLNVIPRDKGHLQNYYENPIPVRQFDDRPMNENYIQRENYYKQQYQKKVKNQPVTKYRQIISTG